jgi:hypothetical protein
VVPRWKTPNIFGRKMFDPGMKGNWGPGDLRALIDHDSQGGERERWGKVNVHMHR